MIDKSESVNWPNVWWILGADHLTLEGIMGDFRKMSCRLISRGKKHANKFLGEKYPALKKIYRSWRIMLKKNLTPLYVREQISYSREVWEKILPIQTKSVKSPTPHSPTNVQWSCQPFRGWGKKRIWHLCKCHPSTKWLARVHDVVVFKTKVLHFKIESTPMKDTNGKRKFKRMLSVLFVDKRKLFAWNCLSRNSTLFSLGLFWTNQGSEVSGETWGTFRTRTLHIALWSKKSTFF